MHAAGHRSDESSNDPVSDTVCESRETVSWNQSGAVVLLAASLPSFARTLSERFVGSVRVVISRDSAYERDPALSLLRNPASRLTVVRIYRKQLISQRQPRPAVNTVDEWRASQKICVDH